jgi:ParB-like chromosome segregation protein Spo0J
MLIETRHIQPFDCELTEHAVKQITAIGRGGKIVVAETDEGRYMVLYGILRHRHAVGAGIEKLDCIVVEAKCVLADHLIITSAQVLATA